MPKFLVFQLHGPLASWGDIAVGEDRPSFSYPTKSAITGFLAAALGIERENDVQHQWINDNFGVAICVYSSGEILCDYHTVQVPKGKNQYFTRKDELDSDRKDLETIVSRRDYQTDAYYKIAVWHVGSNDSSYTLEGIKESLIRPKFLLYLGRKSCPPGLPLCPVIQSSISLKEAFDSYPMSVEQLLDINFFDGLNLYYWEKGKLADKFLGMTSTMEFPRRDLIRSRKRWLFVNRDESFCSDTVSSE